MKARNRVLDEKTYGGNNFISNNGISNNNILYLCT